MERNRPYVPFRDGVAYSTEVEKDRKFRNMFGRDEDDMPNDVPCDRVHRKMTHVKGREIAETITPQRATFDELAELEARGDITAEVRESAERFQEAFHLSRLDGSIASVDHELEHVDGRRLPDDLPERVERALDDIRGAMRALGGKRDPAGCIVWDMIGEGESLKSWVRRRRLNSVARSATLADARAYLIRGLQLLDAHYRPRSEPDPERFNGSGSLKDLARLTKLVAAIDDKAAGWLASALQYWRQHPDADLEGALGIAPGERQRDRVRHRDAALRRIGGQLQCHSVNETAARLLRLYEMWMSRGIGRDHNSRRQVPSSLEADMREIMELGGPPGESQLRRILGR